MDAEQQLGQDNAADRPTELTQCQQLDSYIASLQEALSADGIAFKQDREFIRMISRDGKQVGIVFLYSDRMRRAVRLGGSELAMHAEDLIGADLVYIRHDGAHDTDTDFVFYPQLTKEEEAMVKL